MDLLDEVNYHSEGFVKFVALCSCIKKYVLNLRCYNIFNLTAITMEVKHDSVWKWCDREPYKQWDL